jgi:hypothetical protein
LVNFSIFLPISEPLLTTTTVDDPISNQSIKLPIYDWSSGDFVAINEYLSCFDWNDLFGHYFDCESLWENFKTIIWPIISLHVPTKHVPHHAKYKPRQYPKNIRRLISRKAAIWRIYRSNSNPTTKLKYVKIANECRLAILNFDKEREERILKANNLGAFYNFVNGKLSSRSGIAPLETHHGHLATSDLEKAEILNNYFESAFTTDNGLVPIFPMRTTHSLDDVEINPIIVRNIIRKLKSNSAAGPDRLPPIFFKQTAAIISFPLSVLFRSFIDLQSLPSEWRHANITPKFKKGLPSLPANYRPIALTCCCCKIIESIIAASLIKYLQDHNLINKQQHGFLKNHSTCTNLLESLNDWTLSLSNHESVVIGYVDFARAFDSVSHPKLFLKLQGYGIKGNLLFWIQAFLTNRTQSVRVGSFLSTTRPVISGIPQGSVLGPIIFNVFINDITDNFTYVTAKLYADDVKLYTNLSSPNAVTNFQQHLSLIKSWATTWQIAISHSKCNILELGLHPSHAPYNFSNQYIPRANSIKDLGVLIDPKLKFDLHIHDLVCRARQRSSLIHRCFLSRNASNLVRAFKIYIRPIVEYASPVWSPSQIYLINALESVQRAFTKRLPGFSKLSYAERLTNLKLKSLEHRRLISDLLFCFKIVRGFSSIEPNSFFTPSPNLSSRGHQYRIEIPLTKSNTRKQFFSNRVVSTWNSLPSSVVSAKTPNAFKRLINQHNLAKTLIFPCVY